MSLRSGQLAVRAGVHTETLRYYERRGLLARPDRSPGGHRLYPESAVLQVRVIKTAQRLGFTLGEIADLIGAGRRSRTADLQQRAVAKLVEVDARIADLVVMREALAGLVDAGCADLHRCVDAGCCACPATDVAGTAGDIAGTVDVAGVVDLRSRAARTAGVTTPAAPRRAGGCSP